MSATIHPLRTDRATLLYLLEILMEMQMERAIREWRNERRERVSFPAYVKSCHETGEPFDRNWPHNRESAT